MRNEITKIQLSCCLRFSDKTAAVELRITGYWVFSRALLALQGLKCEGCSINQEGLRFLD